MHEPCTSEAVQQYLNELAMVQGDTPAGPIIAALLDRSVRRLHLLCASLLHRRYPRLMMPPSNLRADELLSAVVERLLLAFRKVQPRDVRGFFAIANQHMYWELNDWARRLDERAGTVEVIGDGIPAAESSDSTITPNAQRMLQAIEELPDDEREVFNLVRIQGMPQTEVAGLLKVSTKTVLRRLNRGLVLLSKALPDLQPRDG
jgi:RNA polymerase sigma factor (sigma-70 family)